MQALAPTNLDSSVRDCRMQSPTQLVPSDDHLNGGNFIDRPFERDPRSIIPIMSAGDGKRRNLRNTGSACLAIVVISQPSVELVTQRWIIFLAEQESFSSILRRVSSQTCVVGNSV